MAIGETRNAEGLQSLERGLAVIQVFSHEHPKLTLSEVARLTNLTPASARRILLTLENLGHVRSEGRHFSLTPRVMSLGWAYLSSLSLWKWLSRSWRLCRRRSTNHVPPRPWIRRKW